MIRIDKEFERLIIPLRQSEYDGLEKSCIAEGIRDPLVLWNNLIIDGHHRFKIAEKHGLKYKTITLDFPDRRAVRIWMRKNQMHRRNLSEIDWYKLVYDNADELRQAGRERQSEHGKTAPGKPKTLLSTSDKSDTPINTREAVAADLGWSTGKVAMAAVVSVEGKTEDIEAIRNGEETIHSVYQKIKCKDLKIAHVSHNSGNNEWYTPQSIIDAAREVMETLDLDPASNAKANEKIKARRFYSSENDGLKKKWNGRVWMNPPYASDLIELFIDKFIEHYANGDIEEGVILVNNATDTKWFQKMFKHLSAICFHAGRIRFWNETTEAGAPLQGQAICYFGKQSKTFGDIFSQFGGVLYVRAR